MNFAHRDIEQRSIIEKIILYESQIITRAQEELKIAIGVANMPYSTPTLVLLLDVCGHIKGCTLKKWKDDQESKAAKEFMRI